jgi:hypothetical protein
MSALGHAAPHARAHKSISGPAQLILVRVGADGGATRAELASDLAPLFTHKLSPQDFRRLAEKETAALVAAGLVAETKNRLSLTGPGETAVARFFSQKAYEARPWHELRDLTLIAKGLGCETEAPARLKPLLRVEGLRSLIVQKAFGLPTRKNQPPTRQRAQLAVVALERAFGNRIKAGFGKGSALSSKAGRLLAGQLSRTPRSFTTDAKLIAALAAEHVGAVETDLDALRIAILRGLGARALEAGDSGEGQAPQRPAPVQISERPAPAAPAANDRMPAATVAPAPDVARPDLGEFSRAVKDAASQRAEGWPGSRKAYISQVWDVIRAAKPRWELSEIEFKCMLAEAHRLGAIALANADLKDKKSIKELESSAVPYKNTVWHFVRVEE